MVRNRTTAKIDAIGQTHENDVASVVVVCKPSLSKAMGALHPAGALYARPVNLSKAMRDHEKFVSLLRNCNVEVREVSEILCDGVDAFVGHRVALEELAASRLQYEYHENSSVSTVRMSESGVDSDYWITDEYKRQVLREMTPQQLVDCVLTNPRVTLTRTPGDTGLSAAYTFEPLSNIIFVRDQQITTRRGVVMARLRSPQRQNEVEILEFCLRKIGVHVVGRVPDHAYLEGGDVFTAGPGLAFVGVGPRSDWSAVQYLLEEDLFGTDRVAVVKDEFELVQERMHLDTVFNIVGDNCVLMLKDMMGRDSPTRRMVDEYVRVEVDAGKGDSGRSAVGMYRLRRSDVEFSEYVREQGFNIIEVSGKDQLEYGCNILNLGNSHIIATEQNTSRSIASSPHFKGTVEYLDFSGVTCMYGGVHCASQVVRRHDRESY